MAGVDTAADLISWDIPYQEIAELQKRAARMREIDRLLQEDHLELSVEEKRLLATEFELLQYSAEQDQLKLAELQKRVHPGWFR